MEKIGQYEKDGTMFPCVEKNEVQRKDWKK